MSNIHPSLFRCSNRTYKYTLTLYHFPQRYKFIPPLLPNPHWRLLRFDYIGTTFDALKCRLLFCYDYTHCHLYYPVVFHFNPLYIIPYSEIKARLFGILLILYKAFVVSTCRKANTKHDVVQLILKSKSICETVFRFKNTVKQDDNNCIHLVSPKTFIKFVSNRI